MVLMRHYEVMIILDPSLDERTVAPSLENYLNVIRTSGGTVEKVDVWAIIKARQTRGHFPKPGAEV